MIRINAATFEELRLPKETAAAMLKAEEDRFVGCLKVRDPRCLAVVLCLAGLACLHRLL